MSNPQDCLGPVDLTDYPDRFNENNKYAGSSYPQHKTCSQHPALNDKQMLKLLNWLSTLPKPETIIYNRFRFVEVNCGTGSTLAVIDSFSDQTADLSDVESW